MSHNQHVGKVLWVLIFNLLLSGPAIAATYPLKVSSTNPRLLVDQNEVPFLIHGDCMWGLMMALNQSEVEYYLENRRQKGFNTVDVSVITHYQAINNGETANRYGQEPFTSGYDFTTPNEAYFTNVDWVIDLAAQKGIQILLAPCYLGFDSTQGWQDMMVANGTNNCRNYGRFLGNRYKDKPNIIWLQSGDNGDPVYLPYIRELALGIKEFDTNHLHTAKLFPEQSARDLLGGESWLDLNTTYAYGLQNAWPLKVYDKSLQDYNATPAMPSFLVESTFEGEHDNAGAYIVRRQAYWSVLCGSVGQIMGNFYIWQSHNAPYDNGPWQTAMNGDASVSMSYLKKLFDSRPWYSMTPDQSHSVVTSGYGTSNQDDYLATMRATNGSTVMAYVPTARAFSMDMSKISGTQAKAWWFNPRDGSASNFAIYATIGIQSFTPPDSEDWVLVVDDASQPLGAPGSGLGPQPPTISNIPDQLTPVGTAAVIPFIVSDADTLVTSLSLSGDSSNVTLVPTNNIVFGGNGNNRTVMVSPATGQIGSATITVLVGDGALLASNTFVLTVSSLIAETKSYTNAAAITIADSGGGSPYPSVIDVTGLGGAITQVTVTLNNLSHTWPDDVDILLVSPTGQQLLLMSDAGGGMELNDVTLTVLDGAEVALSDEEQLATGDFKPTNYDTASDTFTAPAPSGPYSTLLSVCNGREANGTWSLFVFDDGVEDQGIVAGGWSVAISTVRIETPPQITSVTFDDLGPLRVNVSGELGLSYALEASSDFSNWTMVDVQDNVTGSMIFNDQPTNSIRFYRAVSVPN